MRFLFKFDSKKTEYDDEVHIIIKIVKNGPYLIMFDYSFRLLELFLIITRKGSILEETRIKYIPLYNDIIEIKYRSY